MALHQKDGPQIVAGLRRSSHAVAVPIFMARRVRAGGVLVLTATVLTSLGALISVKGQRQYDGAPSRGLNELEGDRRQPGPWDLRRDHGSL